MSTSRDTERPFQLVNPAPNGADPDAPALDPRLERTIGDTGFLRNYLAYASEQTDAPAEFQLAAALIALATAAGNRIYFEQWGQRIHLNLWMVLISPSGWFRKTTVLNIKKRLLEDAGLGEALFPSQWSRESMLDVFAGRPAGLLTYGEFGSLLAMLGRDYMSGAKEDLTDLFDSPPAFERRLRNSATAIKICYPAISLMAGTVIDWLTGRVREGDVRGGFLARFLFIVATKKQGWMGLTRALDISKKNVLVTHLVRIAKLSGHLDLESIRAAYDAWLRQHESKEPDSDLTGFYARLGTYALKLAALCELSNPKPSLTVSLESWKRAEALTSFLKDHITNIIAEQVTASAYQAKRAKVLATIRRIPGVLHRDLLRTVRFPKREFDEILGTLKAEGSIEEQTTDPGPEGGRPGRRYYPKEATSP